jgi:DNA-directed RNA polymerase specialized sigma24 family protein
VDSVNTRAAGGLEDLARRARAGDGQALSGLMGRVTDLAGPVIRRRVPADDAEDLLQNVRLAVARNLDWVTDGRVSSPAGWIRGIANRELVTHYRRQRKDGRGKVLTNRDDAEWEREGPGVPADHFINREAVESFLAGLTPLHRQVAELWMVGCAAREIQERLNLTRRRYQQIGRTLTHLGRRHLLAG